MPNPHPKPGLATFKCVLCEHASPTAMVRIMTVHDQCQGLWDFERAEVNENLPCGIQDEQVILDLDLARITAGDLTEEIDRIIELGGFHGLEHDDDVAYVYLSFEYVFYDNGRAPVSLEDIPDQDLRRVLAGGEGYIQVVWDF